MRGWELLHRRHGNLPWQDLFSDAVRISAEGHPLTRKVAQSLSRSAAFADESFQKAYLSAGAPAAGSRLRLTDLSRTLSGIASEGADWYYEGPFAKALEERLLSGGGHVTAEDMHKFTPEEVTPLSVGYRGRRVYVTPPPSQGVTLPMMLGILEGFDFPTDEGPLDPRTLHLQVEAKRRAYLVRDGMLTDPRHSPLDFAQLLASDWAERARADIDERESRLAAPTLMPGDTTFLCTMDDEGNACAFIQSLYMGTGSGVMVPGFGVHLQNRGAYFSLDEGHVNAIAPGKRTAHTLMTSMTVGESGDLEVVLGAMGGDGQPQTHLQILMRLIDYGEDVQDAVSAPRWLDGADDEEVLLVEDGLMSAAEGLRARGQVVRPVGPRSHSMGHAQAITLSREGLRRAAADPRGDGLALAE